MPVQLLDVDPAPEVGRTADAARRSWRGAPGTTTVGQGLAAPS